MNNSQILIQVGCNRGNDHVFSYIKENKQAFEKVYLIDANVNCGTKIKEQYDNLNINYEFLNFAVSVDDADEIIFYKGEHEFCEHASTKKSHLLDHRHHEDKIIQIKIKAKNLNSFFIENKLHKIDRLYIDVEGMDIDIVNSIDFDKFDIKYIQFESMHSDGVHKVGERLEKCIGRIIGFGYKILSKNPEAILTKE